jgi:aminoglycoside phosphotransferase family enzyme/predicted kinase
MTEQSIPGEQAKLIAVLAALLREQGQAVEVFETHISSVLVAGPYAYKFKKALHFDFLDFSTLEARRFYCHEEVRLNRRLAPGIYLDVVAIKGSPAHPVIEGPGAALEYAVRMRAFAQESLWSERIGKNLLGTQEIDELAHKLAQFHRDTPAAPANSAWGAPELLRQVFDDSLALLGQLARTDEERAALAALGTWQKEQQSLLSGHFAQRKAAGMVRECHGDLHSGNIVTIDGRVAVFDCIEFNDSLRWIDVISDVAFIYMDLQFHGLRALAARLLNGYLEASGDYEGVGVLRYYQAGLALVRWKIAVLRARQLEAGQEAASCEELAAGYRAFAAQLIKPPPAALIITHGFSGSGKSTCARHLVELSGAIQIRSDVERKRMHGIAATDPAPTRLYDPAVTRATYERLRNLAAVAVAAGMPVIIDAAFLMREQRRRFADLAAELGVPFFILDIHAGPDTLRARVAAREGDASDAGVEVLVQQLARHDALSEAENVHAVRIDSEAGLDEDAVRSACQTLVSALSGAEAVLPQP